MAKNDKKDPRIEEWVISRLKKGYMPRQIVEDVKNMHNEYITMMTIYRWRKKYNANNDDNIPLKNTIKFPRKKSK